MSRVDPPDARRAVYGCERFWRDKFREAEAFDAQHGITLTGDSALAITISGLEESVGNYERNLAAAPLPPDTLRAADDREFLEEVANIVGAAGASLAIVERLRALAAARVESRCTDPLADAITVLSHVKIENPSDRRDTEDAANRVALALSYLRMLPDRRDQGQNP